MSFTFKLSSLNEINDVAKQLLTTFGNHKIIAFYGTMGAGKTTLIKALCQQLGVMDTISSPTFSLVNEYRMQNQQKIYHFDFYRIKTETEAFDFGYEDYFYSTSFCFIEWPEKIDTLLPAKHVKVMIETELEERIISVTLFD